MHPLLVTGEATIAEAGWLLLVAAVVAAVVELLKVAISTPPHLHRTLCGREALPNRLLLLALHACCERWLFSIPLSKQRKQNGET